MSIIKNQWRKELNRRKRLCPISYDIVDKSDDIIKFKQKKEKQIEVINDCIVQLPEKYQEALNLRNKGWSMSQICEALELKNIQSAKDLIRRAREKLIWICERDPRYEETRSET